MARLPSPLPPLGVVGGDHAPERAQGFRPPKAKPSAVLHRMGRWLLAAARYKLRVGILRLRGQDSLAARARVARAVITSTGGTATKVALQVALRMDLLPMEFCSQLTHLPDRGPALPIDVVVRRVEAATHRPLHETFAAFDPVPISAETLSVVHQAELLNGDKVAVRVRRPGAAAALAADAAALHILLSFIGPLFGRKARLFAHIRGELKSMMLEDLDFQKVSRRQRLFRSAARDAGIRWVSAAKIYPALTKADVIVSEFVTGVRLDEVMAVVAKGGFEAKLWLAERDIRPRRLARRVAALGLWQIFENVFFEEAPEPYQVVVEPGDRLKLLHMTDCGRISRASRRQLRDALEDLASHDVEGSVQLMLGLLAPLPPIDIHEFSRYAERRVWQGLFSVENKDAPWWERTSMSVWLGVLKACSAYGVPVALDLLRMMRAMTVWNTITVNLHPRTRFLDEFRRYLDDAAHRGARLARRRSKKGMSQTTRDTLYSRVPALARNLRRASGMLQVAADEVPLTTMTMASKASYAASVMFTALSRILFVCAVGAVIVAAPAAVRGEEVSWLVLLQTLAAHPLFDGALLAIILLALREISFRLDDLDRADK